MARGANSRTSRNAAGPRKISVVVGLSCATDASRAILWAKASASCSSGVVCMAQRASRGSGRRHPHAASSRTHNLTSLGADGAAAMARRPRPQDGTAWCRLRATWGERPARPVTPNVGACPPGRGGRTFGAGGGRCGAAGRARRRRGRGVAASPTAKPAAARPSALSTGSGSREPRRPAGGGLGTDSGSRPPSRQPARKSCPPAPPIAAMRWAACRRSRSPTAGAVRESATAADSWPSAGRSPRSVAAPP